MVLEVSADFIKTLDSVMLVRLMKRLLPAELRLTDIPLGAASVPLQVAVPDGGDVAAFSGRRPRLHCLFPRTADAFQSKAPTLPEWQIRGEILKNTKGRGSVTQVGLANLHPNVGTGCGVGL
jgi:hypothetical protein